MSILADLHNIGALKYDPIKPFTLKSGEQSPYYFDMRLAISYPEIVKRIITAINNVLNGKVIERVCGVPLGGVPYASAYSMQYNIPQLLCREEAKEHGNQSHISGYYRPGDIVLLIEDVVTTGKSIYNIAQILQNAGLVVIQFCIIIRRMHDVVTKETEHVDSLFNLFGIEKFMYDNGLIPKHEYDLSLRTFNNPKAQQLWNTIRERKTNLCLSLDITDNITNKITDNTAIHNHWNNLMKILPHICMIKLHTDIMNTDTDFDLIREACKGIFILDDRKYADIGHIVSKQLCNSSVRADCVTAHGIFGQNTLDGLVSTQTLLIAQSSAKNNLITREYSSAVYKLALNNKDKVLGFICQHQISEDFLNITPGVNIDTDNTNGQQYRTPEDAIGRDRCDIIIVGRGILDAEDPVAKAIEYKERAWKALMARRC